jgi:hypothetical protein
MVIFNYQCMEDVFMAKCPLFIAANKEKDNCIEKECAWYYDKACSIKLLPFKIYEITDQLKLQANAANVRSRLK